MDSFISKVPPKALLILAGGFLLFVIALFVLFSQLGSENQTAENGSGSQTESISGRTTGPGGTTMNTGESGAQQGQERTRAPQPGILAKVGTEYIYEADLNYEASYYPYEITDDVQEEIIQKMILDSVVLQAAAKEKLIELDGSIFNTTTKDYSKRVETVKQVRDRINERSVSLEGSYLTIWFHNGEPGPVGYERGKEIARQKISALQQQVANGNLTMEQAGAQLRADTSLRQVDPSYDSNAYLAFAVQGNDSITIDPKVDTEIRKLKEGQVSQVLTLSDANAGDRPIEAAYVVAQVSQNNEAGPDFEAWRESYIDDFRVERYE